MHRICNYTCIVNIRFNDMLNRINQYITMKRPNTQRSYLTTFADFAESVGGYDGMKYATAGECINYLARLNTTHAPLSVMQKFQALRGFYEFLYDIKEIDSNPWRAAARALSFRQKTQVRPTALINFDLVPVILDSFDHSKEGVRNAAIFAMLFGLGLRRSELLGLHCDDILFAPDGTPIAAIRQAKGGESRLQPIPIWVMEHLTPYLIQRLLEKNGTLIIAYSCKGIPLGPLSESTLYRLYRATLLKFGVKAAPHSARATFASKLKVQNFEDRDVAAALGHSSEGMVRAYDKRARAVGDSVALKISYKKRIANAN